MKNKIIKPMILVIVIALIFYAVHTFALLRNRANGTGSIDTARWSVTRSQSQSRDSIEVIPGGITDTYNLTVQSNSEVDVVYKIIISNLPSGIEVALDNGNYLTPSSGTLTIQTANTVINYNDATKTKNHTLTFRATSGAPIVTDEEIDIDVEFKQDI